MFPDCIMSSGVGSGVGHAFLHFLKMGVKNSEVVLFACALLKSARCDFNNSS